MKLARLHYSQFKDTPKEWEIDDCTFGDVNLIVGRNASGKTMTLNVIKGLSDLLSEETPLKWSEGNYDVEFLEDGRTTQYILEYRNRQVIRERLLIDSEPVLDRASNGQGKIKAYKLSDLLDFQISTDRIAALARRDMIQHPFLETLCSWGKHLLRYNFGTPLGKSNLAVKSLASTDISLSESEFSLKAEELVVGIFMKGKKQFGNEFVQQVKDDMLRLNYNLEDITVDVARGLSMHGLPSGLPVEPIAIFAKEDDLLATTSQLEMSQGMFRALSLLIQVNFAILAQEASGFLIDDIGEGLDFERSAALVQIMIEKVKHSHTPVQLIMTTNDRFIMNKVPLEYWVIMQRHGGRCKFYNYRNAKPMFDEFETTGLSNFDLFSSRFYVRNERSK